MEVSSLGGQGTSTLISIRATSVYIPTTTNRVPVFHVLQHLLAFVLLVSFVCFVSMGFLLA